MIRTNNRVALYARFSSDNQRSESIDAQIRAMKAYCKQHNFIIVNTYIDEAKSATTDKRPSFQQMISDSAYRSFDILLVHKLDRFARNRYDSAVYKRELKKNGVTVYSVLENLDNSPESIMMEAVLEGMSEYYSQNLAREVMKGLQETALQCKHTGGIPPLGYDVDEDTKKLVINEHEAESVKLIFDMYSAGYGYTPILDELHLQGRKTKKGNDFGKNSLYSILTNPKYKGVYIFNRSTSKATDGTRNSHSFKDDDSIITIEGGCPKIVEEDTYNKVQLRLAENKHRGGLNNSKECYLLSGKVHCRECGKAMVGNKRHSGRNKLLYVTYRCTSGKHTCSNKEINKEYLEKYVTSLLEKELFRIPALKRISDKIDKKIKGVTNITSSEVYREELDAINNELQEVARAISSGLISEDLIATLKELELKKKEIEGRRVVNTLSENDISVDIDLIMAEYEDTKNSPSLPSYRSFVTKFIDDIKVGKYNVDITLKTGLDIFPSLNTTYRVRRQEIYEQKMSV